MRLLSCCVCLAAAAFATGAAAQVTQAYAYDANGRLVGVTTSGGSGTNTAVYTYDDANNRTYRGQSGVSAYAVLQQMPADQLLLPHQALTSPDGAFSLAVRSSGQLELWLGDAPMPSDLAAAFQLSVNGEARFLPPPGLATGDAHLRLASDGALTMLDSAEQVLWRSLSAINLEAGQ